MENASKALLIAGSVLIVILLIAVGVRIYSSTQGVTESTEGTMTATQKAQFNSKFTQYIGKKTEAQTRALINTVISSNATNASHYVKINNTNPDINMPLENLNTIEVELNKEGYVNNIKINIKINQ